ncbi:flagellar hook-length control protein FliK [uncultured Sulfitobacter sp.]|uniref:flagellar hook-length control protein FliK n=1 Tax=uncultured Sulfitobacter sp. TaxID=191468 RepID=UPI00260ABF2E|nr:flagellar hook-length control protein FliK [uncultured Sulfitobacter sp.]
MNIPVGQSGTNTGVLPLVAADSDAAVVLLAGKGSAEQQPDFAGMFAALAKESPQKPAPPTETEATQKASDIAGNTNAQKGDKAQPSDLNTVDVQPPSAPVKSALPDHRTGMAITPENQAKPKQVDHVHRDVPIPKDGRLGKEQPAIRNAEISNPAAPDIPNRPNKITVTEPTGTTRMQTTEQPEATNTSKNQTSETGPAIAVRQSDLPELPMRTATAHETHKPENRTNIALPKGGQPVPTPSSSEAVISAATLSTTPAYAAHTPKPGQTVSDSMPTIIQTPAPNSGTGILTQPARTAQPSDGSQQTTAQHSTIARHKITPYAAPRADPAPSQVPSEAITETQSSSVAAMPKAEVHKRQDMSQPIEVRARSPLASQTNTPSVAMETRLPIQQINPVTDGGKEYSAVGDPQFTSPEPKRFGVQAPEITHAKTPLSQEVPQTVKPAATLNTSAPVSLPEQAVAPLAVRQTAAPTIAAQPQPAPHVVNTPNTSASHIPSALHIPAEVQTPAGRMVPQPDMTPHNERDSSAPTPRSAHNSNVFTTPHMASAPAPTTAPQQTKPTTNTPAPPVLSAAGEVFGKEGASPLFMPADAPEFSGWDTARTQATTTVATAPLRADLAPHVARQLVEVMAQAAHKPVEIALSPQELGRVRMSIVADDGTITVNIVAERPETIDLMRRYIDQLGQSFRSMGYDQINFAFGQGTQSDDQSGDGGSGDPKNAASHNPQQGDQTPDAVSVIDLDQTPAGGVDIRL